MGVKAGLAARIIDIIRERKLTQAAAAKLMATEQPRVSSLMNARLDEFSVERLVQFLTALGQDVHIVLPARKSKATVGHVEVQLG
jgi:predicted XRE-type DNA-binding protein